MLKEKFIGLCGRNYANEKEMKVWFSGYENVYLGSS